jgi:thiol-disulfide isomerase/thioredoxin
MFMRSILVSFLLLFSALLLKAEPVVITGTASDYAGKRIAVLICEDEFSGKRMIAHQAQISEQGMFSLTFDLRETRRIFLHISRVEAVMYAEPGHSYEVIFPADASASVKRFDKTEVELDFINLPENDINSLIRNFNADYSEFIATHYFDFAAGEYAHADAWLKTRGDSKTKVDLYKPSSETDTTAKKIPLQFNRYVLEFKNQISEKYGKSQSSFLNDYIEYSMAEIDVLAGMKRELFYREYLMSRQLPLQNPAFVNAFTLFYGRFLTRHPTEKQNAIIRAINVNKNPDEIIGMFENDSTCLSSEVRKLALISGLKELYNDKTYNRKSIEKTLQNIQSENKEILLIARNTALQLQKRREDFPVENFTCIDGKQDKWELSDHTGHNVYLLFFATWSPNSLKELQVMQKWHEKYGRHIEFVGICMDDDFETFKEFISSNREIKFDLLFGNADPLIAEKALVYAIPEAVMLNEEGRTVYAHTRKPSEGIQMDFDKIMLLMQQNPNGPKTWKN